MRKYEYQFLRLTSKGSTSPAIICGKEDATYQDVICKYGEDGWRLIQIVTLALQGGGLFGGPYFPSSWELIFGREVQ